MNQTSLTRRKELHNALRALLGENVKLYWEPPTNTKMTGDPRVIYERNGVLSANADNQAYLFNQRYTVTICYTAADCSLPEEILRNFKYSSMDREFVSNNMHHSVLTLYY